MFWIQSTCPGGCVYRHPRERAVNRKVVEEVMMIGRGSPCAVCVANGESDVYPVSREIVEVAD